MNYKFLLLAVGLLALVSFSSSSAQVPQLINYQGKLTKSTGAPLDTNISMVFSIYADSAGTILKWTETQGAVVVEKGVFNVLLGNVNPIPDTVFNGNIRYLGVKVGGDPEITPRKPMVSVPYAYRSATGAGDNDWTINGDNIYHLNGNVGIGTTSPVDKLEVGGGGNIALRASADDVGDIIFRTSTGTEKGRVWSDPAVGSNKLFLRGGSTTTGIVIDSAGNVGIGTTTPNEQLSVVSTSGTAFKGSASGSSGSDMIGVGGYAGNSSTGHVYAGFFSTSSPGTGYHYGVYVNSNGSSGSPTYGVGSDAVNNSTGNVYGGAFYTYSFGTGTHYGVSGTGWGSSSNPTYGVSGWASNVSTGNVYAGYFYASPTTLGTEYGVYSYAPTTGYAGYFVGNHVITGTKSAAVKVDNGGYRLLYSMESPENWFEDFGEGSLANGRAVISLDPLFIQTVNTNVTYHVFLTSGGDCNGLYVVNKTPGSFEVRELKGGNSNLTFSYRIVAKRKGYEDVRLAKMLGPTPEQMEAEHAKQVAETEQERARMDKEQEKMAEERVKMEKMEER